MSSSGSPANAGERSELNRTHVAAVIAVTAVAMLLIAVLSRHVRVLHYVGILTTVLLFLGALSPLIPDIRRVCHDFNWNSRTLATSLGALGVFNLIITPSTAATHPLLLTPLTGHSDNRPAIRVDVRDDGEILGTAELYLSVQSSRFPSDTIVLFPVNRGDFQGCRSRFIQLPFEVRPGDTLLFNLIDDDDLSDSEEQQIINASRAGGYCLVIAGVLCKPELSNLIEPGFMSAAQLLSESVVMHYRQEAFQNMGVGDFIVQNSHPSQPHEANPVAILDGNYARATVRVYFPTERID